jgi:hypothetical protein
MNEKTLTLRIDSNGGSTPDKYAAAVAVTESGTLIFKEETTRTEWREVGMMISKASRASTRWLASWRKFGTMAFGEDVVELETGQLCFPQIAVAQARQLEMLPEEVFSTGISPQHAKVLAEECAGPAEMSRWAKAALDESLTPGELRNSIDLGRVTRRTETEQRGGGSIASIHGVRGLFDRWASSTLKERPLDVWELEDLRALLDELKPIYLLCERAAAIWKSEKGGAR